jgi:hypothetical protein
MVARQCTTSSGERKAQKTSLAGYVIETHITSDLSPQHRRITYICIGVEALTRGDEEDLGERN